MKYYIEITLLPGVDIGLYFLWEKVFQQIHFGLVNMGNDNHTVPVGLSIPEYNDEKYHLGTKLRLFAQNEENLEKLNTRRLLSGYLDYVHLTRIRTVPEKVETYACYKRQQPKSNIERLARRKARREGLPVQEALSQISAFQEKRVKTPYVNAKSISTGHRFKLFIQKQKSSSLINEGFSCYGLSPKSTVPEF